MCNKVGYDTKQAAVKDAKLIMIDLKRYGRMKGKLKPYDCPYCNQWHLTSKKQEKYRR